MASVVESLLRGPRAMVMHGRETRLAQVVRTMSMLLLSTEVAGTSRVDEDRMYGV